MIQIFVLLLISFHVSAQPLCDKCNVIVIALDALQAAHVHHLGYAKPTTPELDKLAARGFVFQQAISPSSWTVPTYLSLFSSMYPSAHGLTNRYQKFTAEEKIVSNFKSRTPEIRTMAQAFQENGYRTGGFTGDSGVSAVLGYDKGFETFTDDVQFGGLANSSKRALDWLKKLTDQRFFLFLHGYDSHGQFQSNVSFPNSFWDGKSKVRFSGTREEQAELREKGLKGELPALSGAEVAFWRAWYDQKIFSADIQLGNFIQELQERGLLKKTLIVVLSDHGSEFYEHKQFDHGHSLYEELVHVPFLFVLPDSRKPQVFREPVGTLNLLPTLLDLVGIAAGSQLKAQMSGKSLVPALRSGRWLGEDIFSETDYRGFTHKRSLRTRDGWKYIMTLESGKEELYNLRVDSLELHNVAHSQKAKMAELKRKLSLHLSKMPLLQNRAASSCLPVYAGQCE